MKNVGFIKVEQGDEKTVVHIHGKGMQLAGDHTLQLYVFYMRGQTCVGIWQAELDNTRPAVNYRLTYTRRDTGRPEFYPLIEGIVMENAGRRRFAAVWSDTPAPLENMEIWREPEEPQEVLEDEMSVQEAADVPGNEVSAQETADVPEDEMSAEETADVETDGREEEPPSVQYMKIQRQDIAKLPRCEWKLANNSFLLHGYYNYHHLIVVDEGDDLWLGVPGIYHPREARAAEAFGFPRFIRPGEDGVELEPEEKNEMDDFGYWCRQVKR